MKLKFFRVKLQVICLRSALFLSVTAVSSSSSRSLFSSLLLGKWVEFDPILILQPPAGQWKTERNDGLNEWMRQRERANEFFFPIQQCLTSEFSVYEICGGTFGCSVFVYLCVPNIAIFSVLFGLTGCQFIANFHSYSIVENPMPHNPHWFIQLWIFLFATRNLHLNSSFILTWWADNVAVKYCRTCRLGANERTTYIDLMICCFTMCLQNSFRSPCHRLSKFWTLLGGGTAFFKNIFLHFLFWGWWFRVLFTWQDWVSGYTYTVLLSNLTFQKSSNFIIFINTSQQV